MTAQHYLSPLRGAEEYFWDAYIILATETVKEHGQVKASLDEAAKINAKLYNDLGGFIMRNNYPTT